jgi:translocation and assembly module TamA
MHPYHGYKYMKRRVLLTILSVGLVSAVSCAQENYAVNIEAPPDIKTLLSNHLDIERWQTSTAVSPEQLQHLINSTPAEVTNILATQGYFTPQISTKLKHYPASPTTVTIQVEPGPATKIHTFTIDITGTVTKDALFTQYQKAIRQAWPLRHKQVFTQRSWEASKRSGELVLSREKYARARLESSVAKIMPATQQAELCVAYNSGPIYTLGDISIKGLNKYPERMVRQQIHIDQGEHYSQEKLLDLQSTLQNFPHFTSAIVELDFQNETVLDADHIKAPLIVTVQEAPVQKMSFGLGYGSDSGMRGEIHYQHHNLTNRGWVLTSSVKADHLERSGDVRLTIPKRGSGYDDSFYTKYKQSDIENLFSRAKTIAAQRTRKKRLIETELMLDYTLEAQQFDDGSWEQPYALVLNYKWIRRNIDNISNPRSGNMVWLEAGVAGKGLLSDTSFIRLHGVGVKYWKIGKKNTLIGRLEMGQVFAGNVLDIPSKWLFRAGGSNSVRGYNYESLGVKRRGSVIGGRVVGTGTLEYQQAIYKDWRAALFVDAGDAARNWQDYQLRTGAGLGARWTSPVGIFGADMAYGLKEKKWRFYLSMGLMF